MTPRSIRLVYAALALALWLSNCALFRNAAPVEPPPSTATGSLLSVEQQSQIALVQQEALSARQRELQSLYDHWTTGVALDTTAQQVNPKWGAQLEQVREAMRSDASTQKSLQQLERFLVARLVADGLRDEDQAVTSLEASLSFRVDGQEVALRSLARMLLNEKSALKRRALWQASQPAYERLAMAIRKREEKLTERLAQLNIPSSLEWASELRDADLDWFLTIADQTLSLTERNWAQALERQVAREVRLPLNSVSRADLPRVMLWPPALDTVFPAERIEAYSLQVLDSLQMTERPVFDFSAHEKKNPIPFTTDLPPVRSAMKPVNGLRSLSQALFEVGYALASHLSKVPPRERLLGGSLCADLTGFLFESLLTQPAFLSQLGIPQERHAATLEAANDHRLFALRRSASAVLTRLLIQNKDEAAAQVTLLELANRGLRVKHEAPDSPRLRTEVDSLLREAPRLKAALGAAALSDRLELQFGKTWWTNQSAAALLKKTLQNGQCDEFPGFSAVSAVHGPSWNTLFDEPITGEPTTHE